MSHATYAFLINIDTDNEESDIADLAVDAIANYAEHHCDENNWFQEQAVVLQDGRFVGLCGPQDYRGREALAEELAAMPQKARWEWSRLYALQCVATDMEIGGRPSLALIDMPEEVDDLYWKDFDKLHLQILQEMPPRLEALYAKGSLVDRDQFSRDRYDRGRWSQQFGLFVDSVVNDHPPFGESRPPYDYRAFDLVCDSTLPLAIVFVDIHT